MGVAGDLHAPHADRGLRAERREDGRRRQGDVVVLLGQPGRGQVPPTRGPSTSRAHLIRTRGFGGGGAHFCLGANLARREISVLFEELHRQIPDIQATEEPARLLSPFIHGIKRLPVSWTPPR